MKLEEVAVPVVDTSKFIAHPRNAGGACEAVARSLDIFGIVIIRDHRLKATEAVSRYEEMATRYFAQSEERKRRDERPKHQVGWTPPRTEHPRPRPEIIGSIMPQHQPHSIDERGDAKERFFTPMGNPDPTRGDRFAHLNPDPLCPEGFPEWTRVAHAWGRCMLDAAITVGQMAAIGFCADDLFTPIIEHGPHLLSSTGSNLREFGESETTLAGAHCDLNAWSLHGATNYPGLIAWTRGGIPFLVQVPSGHVLVSSTPFGRHSFNEFFRPLIVP